MAVDVGTAWADISMGSLGRVPISPALPLGILLACMVGLRRLGLDHANIRAWREFLIVGGFVLVFGIWRYSMYVHGGREALGLILAALGEELVYRLAVLILVGAACAKLLGRNWRNAEDWGVVPGHRGAARGRARVHVAARPRRADERHAARAAVRVPRRGARATRSCARARCSPPPSCTRC